jgi:hypothetical protein
MLTIQQRSGRTAAGFGYASTLPKDGRWFRRMVPPGTAALLHDYFMAMVEAAGSASSADGPL